MIIFQADQFSWIFVFMTANYSNAGLNEMNFITEEIQNKILL